MSDLDTDHLQNLLQQAQAAQRELNEYLEKFGMTPPPQTDVAVKRPQVYTATNDPADGRVVEGIFDGVNMLGLDGKQYTVSANYASKSKLVEGDRLKLTISSDGTFIYKQIGPVDRERKIGVLKKDEISGSYLVEVEGRPYRVLLASVTFFDGSAGDEVVILVPSGKSCRWAAVENIIKS